MAASFFISYNKYDSAWAEWIAWQLENAGYRTIIQAWDFKAGSNFVLQVDEALKQADHVIVVLSSHYVESGFAPPEWAAKFVQDPTGKHNKVIPVRIHEIDCEGLLSPIVYIDLVGKDENGAKHELLSKLKLGRAKPDQKPSFPGMKPKPEFPGPTNDTAGRLKREQLPPDPEEPFGNKLEAGETKPEKPIQNYRVWRKVLRSAVTLLFGLAVGTTVGYFISERMDEADRTRAEPQLYEANSQLSTLERDYEALQNNPDNRVAVNSRARELLQQLLLIADVNLTQSMKIFKYEDVCYSWGIVAYTESKEAGKKRLEAATNMLKACNIVLTTVSDIGGAQKWIDADDTKARADRLRAVAFCVKWQVNSDRADRDEAVKIISKLPVPYLNKEHPEKTGELQPCLMSDIAN